MSGLGQTSLALSSVLGSSGLASFPYLGFDTQWPGDKLAPLANAQFPLSGGFMMLLRQRDRVSRP